MKYCILNRPHLLEVLPNDEEFPVDSAEIRFHSIIPKHQLPDSILCSLNDQVALYPIPPFSGTGTRWMWCTLLEAEAWNLPQVLLW